MKLLSLELEQFRKFDRPVRLSGFTDGLNVLCGPNEFGKSTVLAAIRGLLFERHNSKADPIKRMQTRRGNAAPRIAMDFELGGDTWRIEKRFLHQPMACLTGPGGSRFDGEAAEEELQRLLGFGTPGKQGARLEHMGVWGALWVTQRDSVLQADLSSDLARSTITSCLDTEVGVLTGSEKGRAILRAAREQLSQLLDGNGKPKGRYKQVSTLLDEIGKKLDELRDRARRLAEDSDALRDRTAKLQRESDPAADQRDEDALADARLRKEAALVYQQRLKAAASDHELAERSWQDAERERAAREARMAAIRASEAALAEAAAQAASARAVVAEADGAVEASRATVEAAQRREADSAQAVRRMREVVEVVRRAAALDLLKATYDDAEVAQGRVNELVARLDAMRITRERIDAIRKAMRERDAAHAVLEAQATRVTFDLLPEAASRVAVDGKPLSPEGGAIAVVEDTELSIAGVGRIHVCPAIRDREKLLKRLTGMEAQLQAALIAGGCTDPAEAEAQWADRETLERALDAATGDLKRLVPGDPKMSLAPGIGPLREHVDVLRRRSQEERVGLALEELPTQAEAETQLRATEDDELTAREAVTQARAELDGISDRRSAAREAMVTADGLAGAAQAEQARLRTEIDAAEAREPADALALRLAEADARRIKFAGDLATLQRDRPVDTPEAMQARIERYEKARDNRRQAVRTLREEIVALRARIAQEGGNGLDEQIATADREREGLLQEQAACLHETRVLALLLDALTTAEREAKERYLAPVVRRVTPYLQSLFPGAAIACDESLRITGITREVLGAEDFDRLSDGTQEQVAVLARLAFAEMLIDQGKPAMVILDDALAYSDPERMERMFDVLAQAAAKMQILILTCREDLFARLGATVVELTRDSVVA
jgi:DNA repair exonuclease SbcCD ATPase subunit